MKMEWLLYRIDLDQTLLSNNFYEWPRSARSPQINCFVGMTADPKTSWWALHKLWLKALSCSRLSTVFLIMDSLAAFIISKFAQKSSILDILHFFFKFPLPLYLYATFLMTINYGCWNELKKFDSLFLLRGLIWVG